MESLTNIPTVAHVIQQALTPVFLLGGVGAFLSVMTGRLARAVDRFRVLNEGENQVAHKAEELLSLTKRVELIQWAIVMCIVCAFLVCIAIVTLFLGAELGINLSRVISVIFIVAIVALAVGLLFFLREISLATGPVQIERAC
jgi:amino acid transporter